MNIKAFLTGLGACVLLSGASHAAVPAELIRNFNLALEGDDPSAVIQSAEALIGAAVENPDDPNARGAAFEAGTQLCLRDACDRAIAAAPLMTGEGTEEVSAALANLLIVYATWTGAQTGKNTADLKLALEKVGPEAPTLLTITAFDRFQLERLKEGKLSEIRWAAEQAAAHYKPFWTVIPENWGTAELSAAAAQFNATKNDDVLDRFAKLEIAMYPFKLAGLDERPSIERLYYQAYAWRLALASYFQSADEPSTLKARAAEAYVDQETRRLAEAYYATREPKQPGCTGRMVKPPKPEFPQSAAKAGYVGAVIVGFEINEGRVENARILASVPDGTFETAVLESMKPIRWEYDEAQEVADCRRSTDAIYPFNFVFAKPEGSIRR
ncbi:MAG: TonB family protein [Hyphomonas sp.]